MTPDRTTQDETAVDASDCPDDTKYIYWIGEADLERLGPEIEAAQITLAPVTKTACQTLNATGRAAFYATPRIWSGLCRRQGSWYRASSRVGLCLVVSQVRLPASCDPFLDACIRPGAFQPESLPSEAELLDLVDRPEYQGAKPEEWERTSLKDKIMLKLVFTLHGFWGWGDNLRSKFLGHRANHANFLARRFTTDLDGEAVPYSVTPNCGVCSSCAEFFNVIGPGDRKLVRACPGSVIFAGLERETYYDVVPLRRRRDRETGTRPQKRDAAPHGSVS